ncbi:MAG: gluconate 2-dehydrogenase subunit 3 family protein [Flavobacteriaceae bacterium]|nr:gluconate 2-dehydrogenase subunit 3 family protein [Flavobacteriaceae bacterium]
MERREAIVKLSWIMKSAFLAPAVLTVLQSCQEKVIKSKGLLVLNGNQNELVKAISDTIIPKTHSPSASDVKVNKFIDLLLNDVFNEEVKQKFLDGLSQFDNDCLSVTGNNYVNLNESEQYTYLEKIDKEIMEQNYDELAPFYYTFKHLTITIYFTTEQGVKQNLNYNPIPGRYIGDVDLKPEDKIMIGNRM